MEIKDIQLYEYIKPPEIPPASHLHHIHQFISVPTEFVITKAQHLIPRQARVFSTHLWILDDQIVGYDTLRQENNFRGTSYYNEVLLAEVWYDHVDDGHTDYHLDGWMYITQSRLDEELKDEFIDHYGLPLCMRWGQDYKEYYERRKQC